MSHTSPHRRHTNDRIVTFSKTLVEVLVEGLKRYAKQNNIWKPRGPCSAHPKPWPTQKFWVSSRRLPRITSVELRKPRMLMRLKHRPDWLLALLVTKAGWAAPRS